MTSTVAFVKLVITPFWKHSTLRYRTTTIFGDHQIARIERLFSFGSQFRAEELPSTGAKQRRIASELPNSQIHTRVATTCSSYPHPKTCGDARQLSPILHLSWWTNGQRHAEGVDNLFQVGINLQIVWDGSVFYIINFLVFLLWFRFTYRAYKKYCGNIVRIIA